MKLRVRLVLAFLLLSVVPLGAVTIYSYISNYQALQAVATREADQLSDELSQRMQLVTAQLSERVEHLMDLSSQQEPVVPAVQVKRPDSPAKAATPIVPAAASPAFDALQTVPTDAELAAVVLKGHAADALGEAAMLLNTVELRGLRVPGGDGDEDAAARHPIAADEAAAAMDHAPCSSGRASGTPSRHRRDRPRRLRRR